MLTLACAIVAMLQADSASVPQQRPPTLAVLQRLVTLYKELNLPLPPPRAPLVAVRDYYLDDGKGGQTYSSCGYLLSVDKDGKARVFLGTDVCPVDSTVWSHPKSPLPITEGTANTVGPDELLAHKSRNVCLEDAL